MKTLRQMAEAHGVSHTAIRKRAEREGWTRDLSSKIAAKAEALVRREAVPKETYTDGPKSERQIIESNALAIARVRISHRDDIAHFRAALNALMAELRAQDALPADSKEPKLSLQARIKALKDGADTMRIVVGLEREAFGIRVEEAKDDSLATMATSELFKLRQELRNA